MPADLTALSAEATSKLLALGEILLRTEAVAFRWKAQPGWPVELVSDNVRRWGLDPRALERGEPPFSDLIHPEDLARVAQEVGRHAEAGIDHFHQEYRLLNGNNGWRWVEDHTWVERGADGRPLAFNGVLVDVTERKLAETGLEIAAGTVPALLDPEPDSAPIHRVLERLGLGMGADRAYIFENHADATTGLVLTSQRHEWCQEGVEPQIDNPLLQQLAFEEIFPRWLGLLRADQAVCGCVADFPADEREWLQPQAILTLLVVPVILRGRLWGFLGFDAVTQARNWTASEERVLRLTAAALGAAIEQQRTVDALRESEERLRLALEAAGAGAWELRMDRPNVWSDRHYQILGYAADEGVPSYAKWLERVHPADRDWVQERLQTAISACAAFSAEYRIVRPDGEVRWVHSVGKPRMTAAGHMDGMVGILLDIHDRKQSEERLRQSESELAHLAHYDPLTQLPNRLLAHTRLAQALARAEISGERLALFFIDMDRFKTVNDSLGHEIGDELLQAVGQRLRAAVAARDTVARLGGDEFLVITEGIAGARAASALAQHLLSSLNAPFQLPGGHEVFVDASIGVSLYPEDGTSAIDLVRCADAALYRAKDLGRNTFHFYTPGLIDAASDRLELEGRLRHALARGEFEVHYQPLLECEGRAVIGVEALVRWQPPGEAMVYPGRFIALAEETGLIGALGEWVLETACRQVQRWRRAGASELRLAVNLSARQLRQPEFPDRLTRVLTDTGLDPDALELEITESILMEHGTLVVGTLHALRSMGVRVAIDDFGTGYSSLAYLKRLPLDTLKIDRSFVADIPSHEGGAEIAAAIIALAHQLHFEVLAEGVESEAQLDFLREHGCDYFQGFLVSPAVTAEEFTTKFLKHPPTP